MAHGRNGTIILSEPVASKKAFFDSIGKSGGFAIIGGHAKSPCEDGGFFVESNGKGKENARAIFGVFDAMRRRDPVYALTSILVKAAAKKAREDPTAFGDELLLAAHLAFKESSLWSAFPPELRQGSAACAGGVWEANGNGSVCWIGDCRAYIVRDPIQAELITNDHSTINVPLFGQRGRSQQALFFNPDCLEEIVHKNPGVQRTMFMDYVSSRSGLSRFIGKEEMWGDAGAQSAIFHLGPGDYLVLVSDGIGDVMTKKDVAGCIHGNPPDLAAKMLILESQTRNNEGKKYRNKHGQHVLGKQDDKIAMIYRQPLLGE